MGGIRMKLKFLTLALSLLCALTAIGGAAHAGPEVPFPLNAQLPFPWNTIEGVWEAKDNDINALFSFQVQNDSNNRKILKVIHLSPDGEQIIAEGTALAVDDKMIVRGAMTNGRDAYVLIIRAFRDKKGPRGARTATVLTLRPFNGAEKSETHVVVRKISNSPFIPADEKACWNN